MIARKWHVDGGSGHVSGLQPGSDGLVLATSLHLIKYK